MSHFRAELEQTYRDYSNDELLDKLNSGALIDLAQDVARQELKSRGMDYTEPPADTMQASEVSHPQENFEVVATFATTTEAYIVRGQLETEGIPAFIPDDHLGTANAFLLTGAKSIRIMVPESLLQRASDVIHGIQEGRFAIENDAESVQKSRESQSDRLSTEEAFLAFSQDPHLMKAWQARLNQTGMWAGFNPFATVLGVCWFFYRKMYVIGALVAIADVAAFIMLGPIGWFLVVRVSAGILANMVYFVKAKKAVLAVQSADLPKNEAQQRLKAAGGISVPGFIIGFVLYALASRLAGELYNYIHY